MCSTDLIMNSRFTLPGAANRQQINEALAILGALNYVETIDGRQVYSRLDARNQQNLRHAILTDEDWLATSNDTRLDIVKSLNCFTAWNPLANGKQLKSLVTHDLSVRSNTVDDNGSFAGTWTLSTTQHTEAFGKSCARISAMQPQVAEDYTGKDLFETVARGLLGSHGRFKDVYLYLHKNGTYDKPGWRSIALNAQQRGKMMRGDWEGFHRRYIWFPSLNPYAHALDSLSAANSSWDRKVELAAKELEDRKKWKTKEDLRDFLDNYRYKGKGVFDENRLPKGLLSDSVAP